MQPLTGRPLKRADVIRHTGVDHLGAFGPVLAARGYEVALHEPFADDLSALDAEAADLVVVLGGAISVNDTAQYPFIRDELAFIERRLRSGKPMVGACLGGQMIAKALGARVYENREPEVGFRTVDLTPEGHASPLAALAHCGYRIMHWHHDAFDLPAGATRLAFNDMTENQAFSFGSNVLGLQFHMEACPRVVGGWLVAYTGDIARAGYDIHAMRREIAQHGEAAAEGGARTLAAFLDGIAAKEAS